MFDFFPGIDVKAAAFACHSNDGQAVQWDSQLSRSGRLVVSVQQRADKSGFVVCYAVRLFPAAEFIDIVLHAFIVQQLV